MQGLASEADLSSSYMAEYFLYQAAMHRQQAGLKVITVLMGVGGVRIGAV